MSPWRIQNELHTCSEISYRIIDVECIRAKTLQLNLTKEVKKFNVKASAK